MTTTILSTSGPPRMSLQLMTYTVIDDHSTTVPQFGQLETEGVIWTIFNY